MESFGEFEQRHTYLQIIVYYIKWKNQIYLDETWVRVHIKLMNTYIDSDGKGGLEAKQNEQSGKGQKLFFYAGGVDR